MLVMILDIVARPFIRGVAIGFASQFAFCIFFFFVVGRIVAPCILTTVTNGAASGRMLVLEQGGERTIISAILLARPTCFLSNLKESSLRCLADSSCYVQH